MIRTLTAFAFATPAGVALAGPLCPPPPTPLDRPDPGVDHLFGATVDRDADRLLVGARKTDDHTGTAFVYVRDGAGWQLEATLRPPGLAPGARLTDGAAIDGTTIILGASEDVIDGLRTGQAYVYDLVDGVWTLTQTLRDPDGFNDDFFGGSVDLNADTAVIGARADDDGILDAGSAFVFERGEDGLWTLAAKLRATPPERRGLFGHGVGVDGDHILVGEGTGGGANNPGAAFNFQRIDGVWTPTQELTAPDAGADDAFGLDVSLDATNALIGSRRHNAQGNDTGAAYLFQFDGTEWVLAHKLLPIKPEHQAQFGNKLSIHGDMIAVGAWSNPVDGVLGAGALDIFELTPAGPVPLRRYFPDIADLYASFGHDVVVHDGRVLVGAYEDDRFGSQGGHAWELEAPRCRGCAADLNADGLVNVDDIETFVTAALAREPAADIDRTGVFNIDDVEAFVAFYIEACS